ncbi:MAG: hypothetical protein HQL05_00600 [Nitrospirae bacterium]|uniref:hypothetical protein n=1 Tax=Candidatus Magnetobacterium casense TaxID=1455061 RepID=UPI0005901F2A|nr:hypothetical protein [Candidatus Magnetobacterium casensis]MBF0336306.1 hypothetical protein [Nitrospirota bacterium]
MNPEEMPVHKTPQEQEMLDFLKSAKITDPKVLEYVLKTWLPLVQTSNGEPNPLFDIITSLAKNKRTPRRIK